MVFFIGGRKAQYENQILAFKNYRRELALHLFDKSRELADDGQTGWEAIARLVDLLKRKGFELNDFTIREEDFGREIVKENVSEITAGLNKE